MNLTVTTAWVIVEDDEYQLLVDGVLYPSRDEAIRHLSQKYKWKVITLEDHIQSIYDLRTPPCSGVTYTGGFM
jgi:hypothetical protein